MSRPGGRPGPWPSQTPSQSQQSQPQPLSWAKRTAFKNAPVPNSGQFTFPTPTATPPAAPDLESGPSTTTTPPASATASASLPPPPATAPPAGQNRSANRVNGGVNGGSTKEKTPPPLASRQRERELSARPPREREVVVEEEDSDDEFPQRQPHVVKYQLRDTPGLLPIVYYGLQHYLSILGSLILIPLVIVPAMGGSYEDKAAVVSTVLLVSGISTLLHTSLGTRLPLIQGPSFVYLAPALAIINSSEFQTLNQNNFKHIMKELQGALIISAAFQAVIGYTGIMTLFLRLINPIVVSSTIAAVGLSFFSYGFTQVGACLEIGILQLLLVFIFSLYLRKIKILGYRAFLIYAVPLGLGITWAIAFILTETGVYSYKGCDANIPASNNISEYCRNHVTRMKNCRANTSHALRDAPWFRFPYPFQWGTPVFNWKMALVMCVASLIASVDSVGSYHASSLLVAERPPTAGVVSRGIGMEGITGILAGIWGTGFGSSTLTENVHTIAVTKMGSRRAVEFGAILLILISLIGKVGGFIASIPDVMVGALLCFMWAMLSALGFSNLRYSANGSSRNSIVVGLALFFSLSVPAYFQQYGLHPNSNVSVPGYFMPYIVASHGPFHTPYAGVNYVLNTLLSFNMVIAFIIALILDNTVPGNRQERGVYVWSKSEAAKREPAVVKDYQLPFNISKLFGWVKWVGL